VWGLIRALFRSRIDSFALFTKIMKMVVAVLRYPEGATLFVMGEPDDAGLVMAVYDGKSGNCAFDTLIELTDEILASKLY
jgi:hypothetical protein